MVSCAKIVGTSVMMTATTYYLDIWIYLNYSIAEITT